MKTQTTNFCKAAFQRYFRLITGSIFITLLHGAVNAQTTKWFYDASHAKVGFAISHFGISETEGKFNKFDGIVLSDKTDFSDAKIDFSIDVNSIDTENEQRDTHLRSSDFFDVAKYPSITFKSRSLKPVGKNKYKLTGDFTMHGVTKQIILDVLYRGTVTDPFGNIKAGFKVTGAIDRTDWGLDWNGTLAAGGLLVGNEVELDINIELTKAKEL
ncbi:YceI like family protein [Fulvivirga imtechensis AK7]|uniref:YceI like family protein n=1 Tax=Fulvivirga imtechensis AK7 TaxID=1237149 RepID=L8K0P2_9BACT|nr:YceI family protein [Fulvivirga imtechensis]ELR73042.1 YceI like family protein [Fulvivirga imtechensis AK7]